MLPHNRVCVKCKRVFQSSEPNIWCNECWKEFLAKIRGGINKLKTRHKEKK